MSEAARPTPYAVSALFEADGKQNHLLVPLAAMDEATAAAAVVSSYYLNGGKLPFVGVRVIALSEEICRNAVAVYDEIARAHEAEEAREKLKLPRLVPRMEEKDEPESRG